MTIQKLRYNIIVILGPTASGKTSVAANLASILNSEVISADSRQVYRDLNLGTGKDYSDYNVNGNQVRYHLIDIVEPGSQYNVYEFQKDFFSIFQKFVDQNKVPVFCGGSGLYIEAVLDGYQLVQVPVNEELRSSLELKTLEELEIILKQYKNTHATSDIDTKKRAIRAIEIAAYYCNHPQEKADYPVLNPLIIGVKFPRDVERARITQRLKERLDAGLINEVQKLLDKGLTPEQLIYYGLEYKYLTQYVIGQISYEEMFSGLNTAIHQFAKRQMTWFRRMERKGYQIHWLDGALPMEQKLEKISALLHY